MVLDRWRTQKSFWLIDTGQIGNPNRIPINPICNLYTPFKSSKVIRCLERKLFAVASPVVCRLEIGPDSCVKVDYSIGGSINTSIVDRDSNTSFSLNQNFLILFCIPRLQKWQYDFIVFKIIFICYNMDFRYIFSFITTPMFVFGG